MSPIIWRTMRTSFVVRYAFQPPPLVCRPRSTKRGRHPHRLSPASVASTCPQTVALCSGSCSSHLRGEESLECRRGSVLPLCARPLLPPAASHSLHFDQRPSLTHSFFLRTSRRRRAVAFVSTGRPPTVRSRLRIRRPAADGAQSLSHPPAGLSHLPLDVRRRLSSTVAAAALPQSSLALPPAAVSALALRQRRHDV